MNILKKAFTTSRDGLMASVSPPSWRQGQTVREMVCRREGRCRDQYRILLLCKRQDGTGRQPMTNRDFPVSHRAFSVTYWDMTNIISQTKKLNIYHEERLHQQARPRPRIFPQRWAPRGCQPPDALDQPLPSPLREAAGLWLSLQKSARTRPSGSSWRFFRSRKQMYVFQESIQKKTRLHKKTWLLATHRKKRVTLCIPQCLKESIALQK